MGLIRTTIAAGAGIAALLVAATGVDAASQKRRGDATASEAVAQAQPGQADAGGTGGSLPGAPGGRGGMAGGAAEPAPSPDRRLVDGCIEALETGRPVEPPLHARDCAELFTSPGSIGAARAETFEGTRRAGRGTDGPSVRGGVGGPGGAPGTGPGAGAGGAGGAGIAGGRGGAGGPGGSSD